MEMIFKGALDALAEHEKHVVVLRDEILDERVESELDILINTDDTDSVLEILSSRGWELSDTGRFIPEKRAMLLYSNGALYKLDIHLKLIDGPYIYMDEKWLSETAQRSENGFLIPSNEAWLLHITLHTILGKRALAEKYKTKMVKVSSSDLDMNAVSQQLQLFNLEKILDSVIKDPMLNLQDEEICLATRKLVKKRILLNNPRNLFRWIRFKVVWMIGQPLGWRNGVLIAMLGPDGAGKSSFILEMRRQLKEMEFTTRDIYMGPWEYPMLPTTKFLKKIGASPRDRIANTSCDLHWTIRYSKLLKGLGRRYLYYLFILWEMWYRYFVKILPHLRLRRIVLADRYVYDLEIGYYNTALKNSGAIRRLISRLVPSPHFGLLLDNDAEIIYSRKKEYPLSTIRSSLESYRSLAVRRNLIKIKTDKPVEVLVREFLEAHWREIIRLRRD